ncbi:MAG: limonene-1,2-epoxide hydrolase family protein [Novosphingobium sp.]|nr:limonene-1,2-epoxide hydrolase family protein [Novosphingobium sp.]
MSAQIKLVEDFIAMWDAPDGIDRAVEAWFTPETVWENHGLTNTTGIDAALEVNRMFGEKLGMHSIKVDMLAVAEVGNKVLTERIDHIIDGDGGAMMSAPVMGIFEIADGKIAAWRDYFDSKGALEAQG